MDAYAVLGVEPDADQEAVKAAHRRLARLHHPDLVAPDRRAAADRRMREINLAYALLRDPQTRARYDRLRRAPDGSAPSSGSGDDADGQWDALTRAAGRWAARWWRANRGPMRRAGLRAAVRARRAGLDLLGRVLLLGSCLLWASLGLIAAVGLERLAGGTRPLTGATGLLAGALLGGYRGTQTRRRLTGLPAHPTAARLLTLAAAGAIVALAALAGPRP